MASVDYAKHACISCHSKKRKCDRKKPSCSTCLEYNVVAKSCTEVNADFLRASRVCLYHLQSVGSAPYAATKGFLSTYIDTISSPDLRFSQKSHLDVLNHAEYDAAAYSIAQANGLVSSEKIDAVIHAFFSGPHTRLPILAFDNFDTTLIHAIYLVLQRPYKGQRDMASLLYLRTKNLVEMAEASGIRSLQLLQARILIAYYELGHCMVSAAASSVGACAKKARFMGLSPYAREYEDRKVTQERRRTWWALFNLDRYRSYWPEDLQYQLTLVISQGTLDYYVVILYSQYLSRKMITSILATTHGGSQARYVPL